MIILGLIFLICGSSYAESLIELLPNVEVKSPQIRLSEIGKFRDLSVAQMSKIESIILGDSPSFGESRVFSNNAIAEMIRAKLNGENIKLVIPASVEVKYFAHVPTLSALNYKISAHLRQIHRECLVHIGGLTAPSVDHLAGIKTWELNADWDRIRGSFQIPMEVTNSNGHRSIHWVLGKSTITCPVVIARRDFQIGETIAAGDIDIAMRDVTHRNDTLSKAKEAIDKQIKAIVRASTYITRAQVQIQPDLKRGDHVTAIIGEGMWSVSIKAISEQNAVLGDQVRIQNPVTKKYMVGILRAEGVVEVK